MRNWGPVEACSGPPGSNDCHQTKINELEGSVTDACLRDEALLQTHAYIWLFDISWISSQLSVNTPVPTPGFPLWG